MKRSFPSTAARDRGWAYPALALAVGVVICAIATPGCSDGAPKSNASSAVGGNMTLLSACAWPASFDPSDAGPQCTAGRTYLVCSAPNGAGEGCLSDDPTKCPGNGFVSASSSNPVPMNGPFTCQTQCAPNEYAAVCPAGPFHTPSLPADATGCHAMDGGSGSEADLYCCPCQ